MSFQYTPEQTAWLEALESGEYKQCRFVLCNANENSYCCLGVACEIANKLRPGIVDITVSEVLVYHNTGLRPDKVKVKVYGSESSVLPFAIERLFRLYSRNGKDRSCPTALSELNDNGKSFKEIAAIIRANPQNFFVADL